MRKKLTFGSVTAIILLLILLLCLFRYDLGRKPGYRSTWSHVIRMDAGKVTEIEHLETEDTIPASTCDFGIDKDGEYRLRLTNLLQGKSLDELQNGKDPIGFVTGYVIRDKNGTPLLSGSGDYFSFETTLPLKKGLYEITFSYFADESTFCEFAKEYLCGTAFAGDFTRDIGFTSLPKAGAWTMEYSLSVKTPDPVWIRIAILILSLLLTISFIVFLLSCATKGEQFKERYDERQELEKGKGFRYAFFTSLTCTFFLLYTETLQISLPVEPSILYITGGLAGITVYAAYCIWHESYFALNQNKKTLMISLVLIGLANLIISITSILNGTMVQGGRLTFHSLNLLCATMFLVLFTVMLLKKASLQKASSENDDDEE